MAQRALFKKAEKMTNKETVTRNIGLTFDFVNHFIDNPDLIENLPDNFKLNFAEKGFISTTKTADAKSNEKVKEQYVKVKNTFEFGNL